MTRTPIPAYAADYPEVAQTLSQCFLPFYCINCYRKRETVYLTPDFGPFCEECLKQLPSSRLEEAVEEFVGWWHLHREGSVNAAYDYIDKMTKRLRELLT